MNEREDYLDRLLRGVEDSPEDSKEDDGLFDFGSTAEDDDFLKAFEKSLSGSPETPDPDSDMGFNLDEIDNIVSNAKDKAGEAGQEFMAGKTAMERLMQTAAWTACFPAWAAMTAWTALIWGMRLETDLGTPKRKSLTQMDLA